MLQCSQAHSLSQLDNHCISGFTIFEAKKIPSHWKNFIWVWPTPLNNSQTFFIKSIFFYGQSETYSGSPPKVLTKMINRSWKLAKYAKRLLHAWIPSFDCIIKWGGADRCIATLQGYTFLLQLINIPVFWLIKRLKKNKCYSLSTSEQFALVSIRYPSGIWKKEKIGIVYLVQPGLDTPVTCNYVYVMYIYAHLKIGILFS